MAESILMAYGLLTTDEQLMEMDEMSIEINISEQDEKVLLETAENYENECEIQNARQQRVATTSKHYGQRKEKLNKRKHEREGTSNEHATSI